MGARADQKPRGFAPVTFPREEKKVFIRQNSRFFAHALWYAVEVRKRFVCKNSAYADFYIEMRS